MGVYIWEYLNSINWIRCVIGRKDDIKLVGKRVGSMKFLKKLIIKDWSSRGIGRIILVGYNIECF